MATGLKEVMASAVIEGSKIAVLLVSTLWTRLEQAVLHICVEEQKQGMSCLLPD
jgi:hypothetical protein